MLTPAVRAPQRELQQARRGRDALWAHGISGDNPIVLATIESTAGLPTVRELLAAHHYWRLKGLAVDLVLLNTHPPSYNQELQDALLTTVMGSTEGSLLDKSGGVFIRRRDLLPPGDLATLRAMAGGGGAVRWRAPPGRDPRSAGCRTRLSGAVRASGADRERDRRAQHAG